MGIYEQNIAQSMGPISHSRVSGVAIDINNIGTRSTFLADNDDLTPH